MQRPKLGSTRRTLATIGVVVPILLSGMVDVQIAGAARFSDSGTRAESSSQATPQIITARPDVDYQDWEPITIFANPSSRSLHTGERVVLSVPDEWLWAELAWQAQITDGSLVAAGVLSRDWGPLVAYTAPEGRGQIEIAVRGRLGQRTGFGVAYFQINPAPR